MKVQNLAEKASDFTGNVWHFNRNNESILIDAGTGDSWEQIKNLEKIDKVVLTHSHYDHADNLPKIKDKYSPEIYAYEPDNLPVEASKVKEGEKLSLGGLSFEIFHTPGHKDDSICLYSREEKILFAGDLLFPEGGFGRTDLDEGDRDLLIESIKKVQGLGAEKMFCGHEKAVEKDADSHIKDSLREAEKKEPKY